MKSFSIIHILLFLICMLVYKCASAQDYVVTAKGDTIHGEIKPLLYGAEKKIQVNQPGGKKIFSILDTKQFRYKDELYFPVKGPSGYAYMKLIKGGYLSLYAFQPTGQTSYDGLYLLKMDGSSMEVPNLGFKRQMGRFLEDCENVSQMIEEGSLSRRELDQVIDLYNECIDKKSSKLEIAIAQRKENNIKVSAWDNLEDEIKEHADFEGKATSLEMIAEIKNKLSRSEKIPNFLLEGIKSMLASQADLKPELEKALEDITQ